MILVINYDAAWPVRFEELKELYISQLSKYNVRVVSVEHVGSTSVPGLAAKPIIDCDIVVELADVELASEALVDLGFIARGELGIAQRWAFGEPPNLSGTHTYVVAAGCLSLRNHLCLRETLRSNPVLRDEYSRTKKEAAKVASDIDEYGQLKSSMIQQILAVGGLSSKDLDAISRQNVPSHNEVPR